MILVDHQIEDAVERGDLVIAPYSKSQIQPASYDLRLGREFVEISPNIENLGSVFDPKHYIDVSAKHKVDTYYRLGPHSFVLASTVECVGVGSTLAGQVEGKSSLARIGLQVHCAGFIDPGFAGEITLELFNMTNYPILLYPNMSIAQIKFEMLASKPRRLYGDRSLGSKYQDQRGPTVSRLWENFSEVEKL